MAPPFDNDYFIPEQIAEMQSFLRETPVDSAYDELCGEFNDSLDPEFLLQCSVRLTYDLLKSMGKLPEEMG